MNEKRKSQLFDNVINYIAEWDNETATRFLISIGVTKEEIKKIADGYYVEKFKDIEL